MPSLSPLKNAVEATDVDLEDDEACKELGRQLADECVIVVKQKVSEKRLYDIHNLWGRPNLGLFGSQGVQNRTPGRHWKDIDAAALRVKNPLKEQGADSNVMRISFEKDRRGRPVGFFTNGELDWHSDQQSVRDSQRVVGLMSLWGAKNSCTTFLRTNPAYEALNHEDRSAVDELQIVWTWDGGSMSKDLDPAQLSIVRLNMAPYDGMESPLKEKTASGVSGIHFPSHSFSHFKGVSKEESETFRAHLWDRLNQPDYIYAHDWQDGEIVFMDQSITLHARPTNVRDGNQRTMCRITSYLDHLFPKATPLDYVIVNGERLALSEFAALVDARVKDDYERSSHTRSTAPVS